MSIRPPETNNYGNYVRQGVEVLEELQTLVASKSWRLDCVPKEGKFTIVGCDPSVSREEIEAIFAERMKHPSFKIEILDSFYEGRREFTFMPPPGGVHRTKRKSNCLSPMYWPVLYGKSRESQPEQTQPVLSQQNAPPAPILTIRDADWEPKSPAPNQRFIGMDPALEERALTILNPKLVAAGRLRYDQPPISVTVIADEIEPPLLAAMQHILSETGARINLVCIGHFPQTNQSENGLSDSLQKEQLSPISPPTSPRLSPATPQQRFVRLDPSLKERAQNILNPMLEAARKLRPEQPPIQMAVTDDEIDPPLFEAMQQIVWETGARINLTYLENSSE